MNKAEIIKAVADKTGISPGNVKPTVEALLDEIVSAVRAGTDVHLHGFGTFRRVQQNARKGVKPGTNERIDIPARKAMKFKPVPTVSAAMG